MKDIWHAIHIGIVIGMLLLCLAGCGIGGETADASQRVEENRAVLSDPDASASVDALLGTWVEAENPERAVAITRNGDAFDYRDAEGTYPAAFAQGVLTVMVTPEEQAEVHLDAKSGHVVVVFGYVSTEFVRQE